MCCSAAQKRYPDQRRFAVYPALPSDVPSCPVQLALWWRLHSLHRYGPAVPPADRGRQAGAIRLSGRGVGLQLDCGAVPAAGAEQVGGFLTGAGARVHSDDIYHVDFVHLANVGLNGDFMSTMAAVKGSNLLSQTL